MRTLNYLCEHDISDEDCYKCGVNGIIFGCPEPCPDFKDVRRHMSEEMLEVRSELMKKLGVKDETIL